MVPHECIPASRSHLLSCFAPAALLLLLCRALPGGFIKTVIRVLRCVGHYNSKILLDRVRAYNLFAAAAAACHCLDRLLKKWKLICTIALGNSHRISSKQT
jgi:hypothetical protein